MTIRTHYNSGTCETRRCYPVSGTVAFEHTQHGRIISFDARGSHHAFSLDWPGLEVSISDCLGWSSSDGSRGTCKGHVDFDQLPAQGIIILYGEA